MLQSMAREIPWTCGVWNFIQYHGACDSWELGRLVFTPIPRHPWPYSGEMCLFSSLQSHDGGHSVYAWHSVFASILRCRRFLRVGVFGILFIPTTSLAVLSRAVRFFLCSNTKVGEIPELLHYSPYLKKFVNILPTSHHNAGRLGAHHFY